MRVLALWCPDWPAVAAAAQEQVPATVPVAVLAANRVVACSATARAEGVRRGLRKRDAQARCPQLHVVTADPARDTRLFEPVATAVEGVTPGIEVLRPGLVVLATRSPESLAEPLVDAVSAQGVESQAGIADQLSTAVMAARHGRFIPVGAGAEFLAGLSIRELDTEPSLAGGERTELVDLLWRLGLRRIGDFAALSRTDVTSRFGPDAIAAHRAACDEPRRLPARRDPPADLTVTLDCDPPLDRVDAAAFAGRILAERLHIRLAAIGAACTRLLVHAITVDGVELHRVWRVAEPLTPADTAARVRWQLDGWLTQRRSEGLLLGESAVTPIAVLRLEPVEVVTADALQLGLWGGVGADLERARRAVARVQGLLGGDAVRVGVPSGGRGPADRITLLDWGSEPIPANDPAAPWPGQLPGPAPTVLLHTPIRLLDAAGHPVTVTERAAFSSAPATMIWENRRWDIHWWAGPWPLDEQWWTPHHAPAARAQILLTDSRALLLHHTKASWTLEGTYE